MKDAYCQYEMEKQRNRLVLVETMVHVEAQLDTVAEGVLVGEREDAFDDADAVVDETAVAAADDMAVAAVVLVGKLADADDKAVAEEVDREEQTRCVPELDALNKKHQKKHG